MSADKPELLRELVIELLTELTSGLLNEFASELEKLLWKEPLNALPRELFRAFNAELGVLLPAVNGVVGLLPWCKNVERECKVA